MKPTSIIFIILAFVLIISGTIVCLVAGGIAGSQDVELLCDTVDEQGDAITTHELADYDITSYNIDMENVNINIIGKSTKSYVEFKNINAVTCDFTVSNHKLSLSTINPFNLTSLVKIRENGMGFSGLRHYLFLGKYKKKTSEINIYLSPDQAVTDIKIRTVNGNITVKDMTVNNCTYDLGAKNGNVETYGINTQKKLSAKTVGGNFVFDNSSVKSIEFEVENGNANFNVSEQYNYSASCSFGKIFLDDENIGDNYAGVYPENISIEEGAPVEVPKTVRGAVTSGDFIIKTK